MSKNQISDNLNERIGVLTRREVEARILGPVVEAMTEEFGEDRVYDIVSRTIVNIARQQGAEMAEALGGDSLVLFEKSLSYWTRDDALEIDIIERSDDSLSFDVTRCRYAELYNNLGIAELGALLSCNRDYALIEGFNGKVALERTQTIMEGAACCDFRYRLPTQTKTEPQKEPA